jgi:hypothetical protein
MSLVLARGPSEQGKAMLDSRTPIHFTIGLVAGAAGIKPAAALVVFFGLEMVKNVAHGGAEHALFHPHEETPVNITSDILVEMVGYYLGAFARAAAESKSMPVPEPAPPPPAPAPMGIFR